MTGHKAKVEGTQKTALVSAKFFQWQNMPVGTCHRNSIRLKRVN